MKYLAKPILLLLLIMLHAIPSQATEIIYPDANDYIYSEYEINLIKKLKTSIDQLKTLDETTKFILNFAYDFKNNKTKYYSVEIILMLLKKLSAYEVINAPSNDEHFLLTKPIILKFVTEHENLEIYTDDEIWYKIIVWIFLKPIGTEKDLYMERRLILLKKIIDNNKEYAPIISYLLIIIDEYYNRMYHHKMKDRDIVKTITDNYPDTEFGAYAYIDIACLYERIEQNEKAIQTIDNIFIKNSPNFFLGNSDLFSSAYAKMVRLYYEIGDKEKTSYFMKKINKNIPNIDKFLDYYNSKLNK